MSYTPSTIIAWNLLPTETAMAPTIMVQPGIFGGVFRNCSKNLTFVLVSPPLGAWGFYFPIGTLFSPPTPPLPTHAFKEWLDGL